MLENNAGTQIQIQIQKSFILLSENMYILHS